MNTIYNSVPLSLHQYLAEQKRRGIRAIRLDFTDETAGKNVGSARIFQQKEKEQHRRSIRPDIIKKEYSKRGIYDCDSIQISDPAVFVSVS